MYLFFLCEPEAINLSTLLQLSYKWWLFDLWCWDPTDDGGNGSRVCLSLHQRTSSGRVVGLIHVTAHRCGYVLSALLLCTTAFLETWATYFPKQLGLQWARSFSALPNLANLLLPKLTASSLGPVLCQVDSLLNPAWLHAGLNTGQSVECKGGLNYFQATECSLDKQLLNVKTISVISSGHETQMDTQGITKWAYQEQKPFLEGKVWRVPAFKMVHIELDKKGYLDGRVHTD